MFCLCQLFFNTLTLLHSERQKLCPILDFLSAIGLRVRCLYLRCSGGTVTNLCCG